jgi:hypothetical protein
LTTAWELTATEQGGAATVITGVTGAAAITLAEVPPGTYALTESDLEGYLPDTPPILCSITGTGDSELIGNMLTLNANDSAICTFFNDDIAPPPPPPSEGVPVPASNAWVLGLLALLTLGIGWYFIPARGRRKV